MNINDYAEKLNGMEYPPKIPKELKKSAKDDGIVIVYGLSDDLAIFEGAIYDEIEAYEGGAASITEDGIDEGNKCEEGDRCPNYKPIPENERIQLRALWCPQGTKGPSWMFEFSAKHATFNIIEDGEVYCVGIVFAMADVRAKIAEMNPKNDSLAERDTLRTENARLRSILVQAVRAMGGGAADDVSIEFLSHVPEECGMLYRQRNALSKELDIAHRKASEADAYTGDEVVKKIAIAAYAARLEAELATVTKECGKLKTEVANGVVCPWCGGLGYTVERTGYDSEESCQCYFCHGGYFAAEDIRQDYESMESGNKKLRAELAAANARIAELETLAEELAHREDA